MIGRIGQDIKNYLVYHAHHAYPLLFLLHSSGLSYANEWVI